jgi:hypothetical protein
MPPVTKLFAPDREEIASLDSWLSHAPPERGLTAWKDGESPKEQAKAWLRPGEPAVPEEVWAALDGLVEGGVDEVFARPAHPTLLDGAAAPRQHDLFACARRARETVLVVGVEATGAEGFDGLVADRLGPDAPEGERTRCNLLARALFGRDVVDEATGEVLDAELAGHGYGLWTAAVATIIEAQERGVDNVALVVHQFAPGAREDRSGDAVDWEAAVKANLEAYEAFAAALEAAGAVSFATEYVKPGTRLQVAWVESSMDRAAGGVSG